MLFFRLFDKAASTPSVSDYEIVKALVLKKATPLNLTGPGDETG